MMNTHEILKKTGYFNRSDYGDIAKYAASVRYDVDNETQLLSKVEQRFGKLPPMKTMHNKHQPYTVFGEGIEWGAIEQMNNVMSIPPAVKGAMMPDAHQGYGMPIGGVVALNNAISPGFVGYDIACRMTVTILDMSASYFMENRDKIAAAMGHVSRFGKGSEFETPREHAVMDDPLWNEVKPAKNLKALAQRQLGSSGGGNHFFDALIGQWATGGKFVAIMTHSGSRGTGHKLATHYVKLAQEYTKTVAKGIPKGYEWLDINTDQGREYIMAMNLMGKYAQANHQLIHDHFLKEIRVRQVDRFENHHNFAWIQDDGLVVHRKGATPAGKGDVGIIPGTSGTPSYIVKGLGNVDSLESSSHGAGRPFSRTEAKKRHDEDFVSGWMEDQDILTFGLNADETLLAYKDIDVVMSQQAELVEPVASMLPKIVIMGGKSDDGD